MAFFKVVIAVTGASGSIYARLLLERLMVREDIGEVALIVSDNGAAVARHEGVTLPGEADCGVIRTYGSHDMFAAPASGSARYDAMVVVPCSMGTAGRVAAGISDNLICRAADVMLKERRPLILVPRESPLGTIHLRNLATLSECGAVILPAMPSFYSLPQTLEAACETVVERIMDHLGLDGKAYRWGNR